jgi:hypothetical protein
VSYRLLFECSSPRLKLWCPVRRGLPMSPMPRRDLVSRSSAPTQILQILICDEEGRPHLRFPIRWIAILDLVEERRLGLVGMVIWSVVLLSAACGIGFGVWLSLQRWMLIPPGVVLSALSARILLAAPPRLLWRRTSAVSARPAIPAK